ncbi:DUF4231 domain-containing protein [Streptomyces sp. CRB46]|uniref:DUF4231 domain-containing protein n=1 Tax=Streptomyces sp. CRB46 TaxID=2682613 RepID=UPI001F238978|nr:DUF4231 domain-containing protein [Streptomyces sp. CRB46]
MPRRSWPALLYALPIGIGLHTTLRRARARWQAHRAVAEMLKSLAWQYMVHGGICHSHVANADALFAERVEERLREMRKVGWEDSSNGVHARGEGKIAPVMRQVARFGSATKHYNFSPSLGSSPEVVYEIHPSGDKYSKVGRQLGQLVGRQEPGITAITGTPPPKAMSACTG